MTGPSGGSQRGRRDNGLSSETFSAVADIDPRLADHLLDVLLLREVPAYVEPAPVVAARTADRLYVASDRTSTARELLTQIASELGIEVAHERDRPAEDLLAGLDTEAEFRAIIAGFDSAADTERNEGLSRTLFDPLTSPSVHAVSSDIDDTSEHFVPPPPPPVPVQEPRTALGILVALAGILIMAFGGLIGFGFDTAFPLGVVMVLTGGGMLVMQLRDRDPDDGDDGAVV